MLLYFTNIAAVLQTDLGRRSRTSSASRTCCAIGHADCAYTGRFIYPMLSLEGRKFWILGLLPLQRERLLVGQVRLRRRRARC